MTGRRRHKLCATDRLALPRLRNAQALATVNIVDVEAWPASRCAGPSPKITPEADETRVEQWVEEATEKCPGVPIILVGLKKDLREDPVAVEEMRKKSLRFVTEHDGEAAAREIGAKKYLECSSLSGEGVDDVFEAATRAALLTFEKGEGGGCCVIL